MTCCRPKGGRPLDETMWSMQYPVASNQSPLLGRKFLRKIFNIINNKIANISYKFVSLNIKITN